MKYYRLPSWLTTLAFITGWVLWGLVFDMFGVSFESYVFGALMGLLVLPFVTALFYNYDVKRRSTATVQSQVIHSPEYWAAMRELDEIDIINGVMERPKPVVTRANGQLRVNGERVVMSTDDRVPQFYSKADVTARDIASMDVETYAKHRDSLLGKSYDFNTEQWHTQPAWHDRLDQPYVTNGDNRFYVQVASKVNLWDPTDKRYVDMQPGAMYAVSRELAEYMVNNHLLLQQYVPTVTANGGAR